MLTREKLIQEVQESLLKLNTAMVELSKLGLKLEPSIDEVMLMGLEHPCYRAHVAIYEKVGGDL